MELRPPSRSLVLGAQLRSMATRARQWEVSAGAVRSADPPVSLQGGANGAWQDEKWMERHDAKVRSMRATIATSGEEAAHWPKLVAMYRDFADYQARTERDIPVIILSPR